MKTTFGTLLVIFNLIALNTFAADNSIEINKNIGTNGNQQAEQLSENDLLENQDQKNETPIHEGKCFRLKGASKSYSSRLRRFRYTESYKDISVEELSGSPLGCLKKISLTSDNSTYLTVGGDYRYRFEYHSNQAFGLRGNFSTNSSLHRFMLHTDLQLKSVRAFLQISHFEENGQRGGPGRFDESEPDIHQGFIDWRHDWLNVRVGRQELSLGSGKKTGIREGPNQRRAFDASRITFNIKGKGPLDLFYGEEVPPNTEAFKDKWFDGTKFYGLYANSIFKFGTQTNFDFFYLALQRDRGVFNQGIGEEDRHSLGARLWKKSGRFQYDYEATYQFGDFASNNISAWGFVSETSFGEKKLPLAPRFGARASLASGDKDPTDSKLGTFSALFPNPNHVSAAAIYAPGNGLNIQPFFEVSPYQKLRIFIGTDFQWRLRRGDALYANPGVPLVAGNTSRERYIGWLFNFIARWSPSPFLSMTGAYVRYTPENFVKNAGGSTTDFLMSSIAIKF